MEDPREAAESETRSAEARKPPAGTGRGDVIWPGDVDDREDDDWLELCRWRLPVLSLRENGQRQQAREADRIQLRLCASDPSSGCLTSAFCAAVSRRRRPWVSVAPAADGRRCVLRHHGIIRYL